MSLTENIEPDSSTSQAALSSFRERVVDVCFSSLVVPFLDLCIRTGFLELLQQPQSIEALSASLGWRRDLILATVRTLSAAGFCAQSAEGIALNAMGRSLLIRGSEHSVREIVLMVADLNRRLMEHGKDTLEGKREHALPAWGSPDAQSIVRLHTNAMREATQREVLDEVAAALMSLPVFQTAGRVLDLGGGGGYFAAAMVAVHPSLEVVLLDRAEVIEEAVAYLRSRKNSSHITLLAGDLRAALPFDNESFDVVFASHSLICEPDCWKNILAEVVRTTRHGGALVLRFFAEETIHSLPFCTILGDWVNLVSYGYGQIISRTTLANAAMSLGLTPEPLRQAGGCDFFVATKRDDCICA